MEKPDEGYDSTGEVGSLLIVVALLYNVVDVVDRPSPGLHKLWYPGIRDRSTWSKFGAHGEHGDVFLFSNLGAL